MTPFRTLAVAVALTSTCIWNGSAYGQPVRPAPTASLAQTERVAVALRQGMSSDEVQKLLGKPRRTSLRDVGSMASVPTPGTLQWLYSWEGADRASLRVDFAPKAQGEWVVASWEWASF